MPCLPLPMAESPAALQHHVNSSPHQEQSIGTACQLCAYGAYGRAPAALPAATAQLFCDLCAAALLDALLPFATTMAKSLLAVCLLALLATGEQALVAWAEASLVVTTCTLMVWPNRCRPPEHMGTLCCRTLSRRPSPQGSALSRASWPA